jgi:two-component system sensor histidine kinase KdpD
VERFSKLSGSYIPLTTLIDARRSRAVLSAGFRVAPEIAAGTFAILLIASVAHWLHWPWLPVASIGVVFAVSTLIIGHLGLRLANHARDAELATTRMRSLFELTRRTLEMDLHVEPGPQLTSFIHQIFELDAVAVFDADLQEVYKAGSWRIDPLELAQNVYHFGTSDDDRATGTSRRVVRLGVVPIGSLVVRGETTPLTNSAIAALIAITFDRYRSFANETRIETERQAEQLRATVLDSLAHDYKTPLTAIRAASSGLCEMGRLSPAQADLVALIDEQATLLNDLTTRLLTTARLESDKSEESPAGIALHCASESVGSLIEDVVASLAERVDDVDVRVILPDENLVVDCDRRLIAMLLTQYLDNACKYADCDTTVTVRAERVAAELQFSVHSFGPVIPMADRERIFDRYFRSGNSSNRAAGTGIGLSIAKRIALAHGGAVWVSSDENSGNTFFAAIPGHSSASAAAPSIPNSSALSTTDLVSLSPSAATSIHSPAFERNTQ